MTKITLAIGVALLAGTTMTGAANAGGIRLGFGFPLGSFVAHEALSGGGGGYGGGRDYDRPRAAPRRSYQEEAPARRVAKIKRAPKVEVADTPAPKAVKKVAVATPEVKTAKVEAKLNADPTTTTEIAKSTPTTDTTTATDTAPVAADTAKVKNAKVATAEKTVSNGKSDLETVAAPSDDKKVCRRYSPAIAALVDVPCE